MNVKQIIPHRSHAGIMWKTNKSNKERLISDFANRCAYCDDLDKYTGGSRVYHVEHFAPKDKFPELKYTYENLLYACPYCNVSKSNKWPSVSSDINIVGEEGFVDPCTNEYNGHLKRRENGEIYYVTSIGKYMFFELKLYLRRHQLIYNLGRIHTKLREIRAEISMREASHKHAKKLRILYGELSAVFVEYFDALVDDGN